MKIQLDLLSNALDSMERAIELVAWGDSQSEKRRLKQAVQAIAHCVELLLKERVKRIHPALVWENVDKYPNISARTINSEGALSRLANIGGIAFSQKDKELISSLRISRNAIEHYAWETTKSEADQIIGQALAFAIIFSKYELNVDLLGYASRKDDSLESLIKANPTFAIAFAKRELEEIPQENRKYVTCEFCRAVIVRFQGGACGICGHWIGNTEEDDIPF